MEYTTAYKRMNKMAGAPESLQTPSFKATQNQAKVQPWDNGTYVTINPNQRLNNSGGYLYVDRNNRVTNINVKDMPIVQNTGSVPGDDRTPILEHMSKYTGLPSYKDAYNKYWASIPDKDWNKVFRPATAAQRVNYQWELPKEEVSDKMNTSWGGIVNTTWLSTDDREYDYAPGRYLFGTNNRWPHSETRSTTLWKLLTPYPWIESRPHEFGHGTQMAAKTFEDWKNEEPEARKYIRKEYIDGIAGPTLDKKTVAKINSSHPVLLSNNRGVEYWKTKYGASDGYTGNDHEEAQKIRSFRDGILAAQHLYRNRPDLFAQFTPEERQLLMSTNPWFRSDQELETAMKNFCDNPHIAQMLGIEAMRALSTAQDYDNMQSVYEQNDNRTPNNLTYTKAELYRRRAAEKKEDGGET